MYTLLGEVWTVYCCLGTDIVWFGTSSPLTAPMTPNSHVCRASWALQSVCQMPAKQNTLFVKHIICVCVSRLVVFNCFQLHGLQLMASGPITSWQIDGKTVEMVTDFILGGSKITADGDCNHEIKGRLLLRRKAMANLDSILKSRYIDLYFCLCASTILSWWLWLRSRAWSQAGWFLQFHSSFSRQMDKKPVVHIHNGVLLSL